MHAPITRTVFLKEVKEGRGSKETEQLLSVNENCFVKCICTERIHDELTEKYVIIAYTLCYALKAAAVVAYA
jgi:hypothetical protein